VVNQLHQKMNCSGKHELRVDGSPWP